MSKVLVDYLASLNSCETQWWIYVNPENLDEHICTQFDSPEGWVCIGTPENLSFGFVRTSEVLESYLIGIEKLDYNGRSVRFNRKGLIEAYSSGYLCGEFENWLLGEIEETRMSIAKDSAENFVEWKLPEMIAAAKSEEY